MLISNFSNYCYNPCMEETLFDTNLSYERIEIELTFKMSEIFDKDANFVSRTPRCSIWLGMTVVCILKKHRNIPSCVADSTNCGRKQLFCFLIEILPPIGVFISTLVWGFCQDICKENGLRRDSRLNRIIYWIPIGNLDFPISFAKNGMVALAKIPLRVKR